MSKNAIDKERDSFAVLAKKFMDVIRINIKLCKWILPCNLIKNIILAAVPYVGIVYGCRILNSLVSHQSKAQVMTDVYYLVGLSFGLTLLFHVMDKSGNALRDSIRYRMETDIAKKAVGLDYQDLEKQETMQILTAAQEGEQSSGGIYWFSDKLGTLIGDLASIVYAFLVIIPLLTANSSNTMTGISGFLCSHWMIYLVFILNILSMFLFMHISRQGNEKQYAVYEESLDAIRKDKYFYREILSKYATGKEIRLYHLQDILMRDMEEAWDEKCEVQRKKISITQSMKMKYQFVQSILLVLAYIIIGYRGIYGSISGADVVKYVSALTALGGACQYFVDHFENVLLNMQYLHHYYEYLNLPNSKETGTQTTEPLLATKQQLQKLVITFEHVSFRYPGSQEDSLHDVNLEFRYGEKVALVGKNGAGKTTLILLLCRLYEPSSGRILLNGVDIASYDYQEYRDLFGVVFQDFKLFAMSVAENVAASQEFDENKVWKCLKKAGIEKRVKEMEQEIHTPLYNVGVQGVEVSGGESQKIAIARALYKNAPFIVLDEPTSALDPVAEYEIYSSFDKLIENRMAIYISHRMSSCRFCERIVVLNNGIVAEEGTHDHLLQKQGIYAQMWNAQAQNYAI